MSTSPKKLDLDHGRTAEIRADRDLEVRSPDGTVELRVRITEDGPVLFFEGARVQFQAADSIEMKCKHFSVQADESLELGSEGTVGVRSKGEIRVESEDDCRVVGKMIWLN